MLLEQCYTVKLRPINHHSNSVSGDSSRNSVMPSPNTHTHTYKRSPASLGGHSSGGRHPRMERQHPQDLRNLAKRLPKTLVWRRSDSELLGIQNKTPHLPSNMLAGYCIIFNCSTDYGFLVHPFTNSCWWRGWGAGGAGGGLTLLET